MLIIKKKYLVTECIWNEERCKIEEDNNGIISVYMQWPPSPAVGSGWHHQKDPLVLQPLLDQYKELSETSPFVQKLLC